MAEYRVFIVDDEKLSRESIKSLLHGNPEWKIVGEAANGKDAIRQIRQLKPDLVFLDIEMPKLNGMEMLKELDVKPLIIFTTAYERYAIGAFEESATDYLLKPYTDQRFYKALDRVTEKLKKTQLVQKLETITQLLQAPQVTNANPPKTFNVTIGDTIHLIEEKDIVWINASGNYVEIHTSDKKYPHRETMARMVELLDPATFTRISRSVILRMDLVKQLKRNHNGEYIVILKNNIELKLSRTYRDQVAVLLGKP